MKVTLDSEFITNKASNLKTELDWVLSVIWVIQ